MHKNTWCAQNTTQAIPSRKAIKLEGVEDASFALIKANPDYNKIARAVFHFNKMKYVFNYLKLFL